MKYKIVHRGFFNKHIPDNIIKQNLSELFDLPIEEIEKNFYSKKQYILITGLSEEEADEYLYAVREAGVMASKDLDINLDEFTVTNAVQQEHRHDSKFYSTILAQNSIDELTLTEDLGPSQPLTPFELEKEELKKRPKKADPIAVSEPYLFYPCVRIGRMRFMIRILAIVSLTFFCNNLINIKLFESFGESSAYISICLLSLLGLYFLIVVTQRLSDLNRPASFVIIILLPLLIACMASVSLRMDKVRYHQIMFGQEIGHGFGFNIQNERAEEAQAIKKRIDEIGDFNPHKLFEEYKHIYLFSYVALFFMTLALLLVPGSPYNNVYGAPPKPMGTLSIIGTIISGAMLIFSITVPYTVDNYRFKRQQFDTHFFETIGLDKYLSS